RRRAARRRRDPDSGPALRLAARVDDPVLRADVLLRYGLALRRAAARRGARNVGPPRRSALFRLDVRQRGRNFVDLVLSRAVFRGRSHPGGAVGGLARTRGARVVRWRGQAVKYWWRLF